MPPWKPEPRRRAEFIGARRLTPSQVATLERWVSGGAVEGEPRDLPPLPRFPTGWQLGEPDLVVRLGEPFVLQPGSEDLLRHFVIPIPLTVTRYVKGIEFRPGNARVVHHSNLRIDRTGAARRADLDDPAPGFDGRVVPSGAGYPEGHFLGWTPGQVPPLLNEDLAWALEPGSDLVVQLHLRPGGADEEVQPSVGFFFADGARRSAPLPVMLRLGSHSIDIPAGAERYVVDDSYQLPVDVEAFAVQPHAHFRARDVRGVAVLPDGTEDPLIHIRDWDFSWQDSYRFTTPIALPKGTTLRARFTYDNSAANRRNPDRPPKRIRWGERSADEMGDLWIQVVPRTEADRRRLMADLAPKVMADDAAGYEKMLEVEPGNARLHEAAAALYLLIGKDDVAIAHLRDAVRLSPDSVESHYNLATALARQQRPEEAEDHFRDTLRLAPDHLAAHVNLGAVLRSRGNYSEAAAQLLRALELSPDNAAAHTNLAGVLAAEGRTREAVAHYRSALETNASLLEPLLDLSWLLATTRDASLREPAEALRLAERAAAITNGTSIRALDTLAAALAASGEFDRAITAAEQAITIAETTGRQESVPPLRARLAVYKDRRAWLQP